MILNDQQKILIENIGVFFDKRGLQPALGRIMGFLMVVPGAEATFDDIIEHLKMSKSAVSYGINILLSQKKIEFLTKPGERKRYFKISTHTWSADFQDQIEGILEFERLISAIIEIKGEDSPQFVNDLKKMKRFLQFLQSEIPYLIEKYWATVNEEDRC
ncbi:GbsR/MarR family transcriptional regulator [Anditalea andensis]|uniref:HTH marR-type domain-containing protein n=1 Tax=Anditalea andensis TaxID=1048983 RepID=A0A074LK30_9BACT|nr:hypothetical protein [Anditalea andensis]KEO74147.1 hypothetical protein EL17_08380 [Anditalea andensis]